MRYSYEYKKKCVEMYRSGQWPETPEGVPQKRFRDTVREWVRLENANGPEVLQHKSNNRVWTPEERLTLVMQAISGKSVRFMRNSRCLLPGYEVVEKCDRALNQRINQSTLHYSITSNLGMCEKTGGMRGTTFRSGHIRRIL